jgi:hypothetical protein
MYCQFIFMGSFWFNGLRAGCGQPAANSGGCVVWNGAGTGQNGDFRRLGFTAI